MNQTPQRFSVVLPVYNGEACVATAIESALGQSYRGVELIAVNDGSTDSSLRVLQGFGDRIKLISQSNAGVARSRNRGIEAASGEWIAFLDQDDWWLPEKLDLQLQVFNAHPEIGLVHTAVSHRDLDTNEELPPLDPAACPTKMIGNCFEELLLANPLYNSSVVVRRDIVTQLGGCDTKLAGNTVADYDLWLRIARHHQFGFIDRPVTIYRMHPGQGIHDRRAMLEAELKVLLSIREESRWLENKAGRSRLENLYDGLAVAYFDAGDIANARRCFASAWKVSRTQRTWTRLVISRLPYPISKGIQSLKAVVAGS